MVRGGEVHVIERVERLRQRQIRVEKWRKP
jgi:hypothetical protein